MTAFRVPTVNSFQFPVQSRGGTQSSVDLECTVIYINWLKAALTRSVYGSLLHEDSATRFVAKLSWQKQFDWCRVKLIYLKWQSSLLSFHLWGSFFEFAMTDFLCSIFQQNQFFNLHASSTMAIIGFSSLDPFQIFIDFCPINYSKSV